MRPLFDGPGGLPSDAARPDAPNVDAAVGPDGHADAATVDGAVDAMTTTGTVLFATWNGTLVRIDPDTAKETVVGVLKNGANPSETFTDVVMASNGANTALASLGFMSPRMATVNLCNAAVTVVAPFSRAASPNLVVEGLALHPNGTWYIAAGNSTQTLSPNLGTLDTTTGAITSLGGSVTTVQNDIDMLFFKGTSLYGVDVATDQNKVEIFTVDLGTGADRDNVVVTQADEVLRLAYDASRDKTYAWRMGDRKLLTIDVTTGAVTPVGETHPVGTYGNANIRGFFAAPVPKCD